MIGPGIILKALNVLPFAYLALVPFLKGRANLPGLRSGALHRGYYRQNWTKILFGRHLKVTIPVLSLLYFVSQYKLSNNREYAHNKLMSPLSIHNPDIYDEEVSENAKDALYNFKVENMWEKINNSMEKDKALIEYNLKSEAIAELFNDKN